MSNIALIAPFSNMADLAAEVSGELDERLDIRVGTMEKGVSEAKAAAENGAKVIISRGGTANAIREKLDIPVVSIAVTGYDLMRAVNSAKVFSGKIGIAVDKSVFYDVSTLKDLMNVDIKELVLNSDKDIKGFMKDVMSENIKIVIGDAYAVQISSTRGLLTVLVNSGREAIVQAIREAHQAYEIVKMERARTEEIKILINFAREGIVALDESGKVKIMNPVAEKLLKVKAENVIGYSAKDKIPELSIHKVMSTGCTELEEINHLSSGMVIQNNVPVISDEKVIGAISTFMEASKIQNVEEKVRRELYLKGNNAYYHFSDLHTVSECMKKIMDQAKKFALVDSTVLINGKTGTGKEILVQSIHNASYRRDKPFVAVNCAALPETLLESELFGYEEGAFTGAKKGGKIGLFEMAHRGTLFMDEIGEMPPTLQARLLRVLQERVVRRLGGEKVIPVDVRIIAATNRNLLNEIEKGNFREDLFYRLNILFLNLPPLKERIEDIPMLTDMLIAKVSKRLGCKKVKIEPGVVKEMQKYTWPGNIRELENLIERFVAIGNGGIITMDDLPMLFRSNRDQEDSKVNASFDGAQREVILRALSDSDWNIGKAAEMLKISRTTLWRKIKKYDINF